MPEEQFGPYQLQALIGRGGMGEVFRAFDTVRKRTVALKRLPLRLGADPTFQARFRRESELAARLSEPHIIPIHDYGEIDGQLYIDMPLVSGIDLGDLLERDGALPPARAVDIVSQVAMALDAAHARGLVHRDVKPSNILIAQGSRGDQDFVYLVDFGVARSVGMVDTSLTATGSAVGTLDYMAPERFTGRADDARVDVYALACVLYEALTGRKPFAGDGLPVMMHAHLTVDPPAPSRLRSAIPAALDEVVARGMAKEPDDRYPSTARLAAAARAALTPAVADGRPPAAPTTIVAVPAPAAPHPSERGTAGHAPVAAGAARSYGTGPHAVRSRAPVADSRRFSRISSAASMIIGPALLTAAALLVFGYPDPGDDQDVFLDAVAADPTLFQASALVSLLGVLFVVHGLTGLAHMLRGRYVGMGQIGAGLLIASTIVGKSYIFDVVVSVAAGEEFDRDQVLAVVSASEASPWFEPVRIAVLGTVLGLVLLAVGLVLRGATPMWIPILLAISAGVRGVLGESGIDLSERALTVLDMALFAIPAIGIAICMLRLSDEEWARWAPLDGAQEEPRLGGEVEPAPTGTAPATVDDEP